MKEPAPFKACKSKKEICIMLNISPGTLRRYLNHKYIEELKVIGYDQKQQILTPQILNFLQRKIDLTE
jgi:hypothetical protein